MLRNKRGAIRYFGRMLSGILSIAVLLAMLAVPAFADPEQDTERVSVSADAAEAEEVVQTSDAAPDVLAEDIAEEAAVPAEADSTQQTADTGAETSEAAPRDTAKMEVRMAADETPTPSPSPAASPEITVEIKAKVELSGADISDYANKFKFALKPVDGATMPEGKTELTARNDQAGDVTFTGIPFTAKGTYEYEITEVAGTSKHIDYDTEAKTVTVKIAAETDASGTTTGLTTDYKGDTEDVTFTNTYLHTVKISRVDANGRYVAGVKLKVKDAAGDTVADGSWTTKQKSQTLYLAEGSYTVAETDGGTYAFEVDANGNVKSSEEDVTTEKNSLMIAPEEEAAEYTIRFTKTDLDGNALKGAKLKVTDADGDEVDSWTTDGKAREIDLLSDETYVLVETAAPTGYRRITTRISFTVESDGTVTLKTESVNGRGKVTLSNDKKEIRLANAKRVSATASKTTSSTGTKSPTTGSSSTKKDTATTTKAKNAKTGDPSEAGLWGLLAVTSLIAAVVTRTDLKRCRK